jgi:pimeloyl-ACP methyl ester carboxylesterase
MTVWLIHGFNVDDRGIGSVHRAVPFLRAQDVKFDFLTYPWTDLLRLRGSTKWAVAELLDRAQPGDSVIGHSNGAVIALRAAQAGMQWRWMGLVNPALPTNEIFPEGVPVDVWHNRGDLATVAGAVYRVVSRVLPWYWREPHPWGAMGHYGAHIHTAQGDGLVRNHEGPKRFGHSGIWKDADALRDLSVIARVRSAAPAPRA